MGKKKYKPKLFLCPHCDRATFGTTNAHICGDCFGHINFKFKIGDTIVDPKVMDVIEMGEYQWSESGYEQKKESTYEELGRTHNLEPRRKR